MIRTFLVLVSSSLLAAQVVRNSVVAAFAERSPDTAVRYWSHHPAVEASLGMTQIAAAARHRAAPPASAFKMFEVVAQREPLAPEPFLVRGVQAQLAGDYTSAQKAFLAAQWRDPRSRQAAYFLSEQYIRAGDITRGLPQIALLARLSPDGPRVVAPYLAAYGAERTSWPALRGLFATNPELARPALNILASDARTAPAVLELADRRASLRDAPWLPTLLNTLTAAGDHARARSIWAKASGVKRFELIHDVEFSDERSPSPFNWALTSSAVGLAERRPGGRLHLLYYGQEDGMLATQLLLLSPGSYRLTMQLLGGSSRAKALNWSIWCDRESAPFSSITIDQAVRGWRIDVPSSCEAQWLKLSGSSTELPQQSDVTISNLRVERLTPGA